MIDVWVLSLEPAVDSAVVHAGVSPEELQGSLKFATPELGAGFLRARYELRRVLSIYADRPAAEIRFTRNAFGKPSIRDVRGIEFNLSHACSEMAVAVAAFPVGIDVEDLRPWHQVSELRGWVYAPGESSRLALASDEEKAREFLRTWTTKESLVKLGGEGLSREPSTFSIHFDATGTHAGSAIGRSRRVFKRHSSECWVSAHHEFDWTLFGDQPAIS
jgi:phosphopantetheinyl transferase